MSQIKDFLEGKISFAELQKGGFEMKDLSTIRKDMKKGEVEGLQIEELIKAILAEDDYTVKEVMDDIEELKKQDSENYYRNLFQDLAGNDNIGEAKAGRIISTIEMVQKIHA